MPMTGQTATTLPKQLSLHTNILTPWISTAISLLNIFPRAVRSWISAAAAEEIWQILKYQELAGEISLSGLPDLLGVENTFNGVLCSAVLQHIPDSSLYESFRRIRELIEDNGNFVASFPVKYSDIDRSTNRDAAGRLFHIRPTEKYRFLIERLGFVLIESELQDDSLGRDAQWCVQVWRKIENDIHY